MPNLLFSPKEVKGPFICYENNLKSLKGIPNIINGFLDCSNNKLATLEGCASVINGNFDCSNNKLKNLKYCSMEIAGDFNCSKNKLTTLKYLPIKINGSLFLDSNYIDVKTLSTFDSIIEWEIKSDFGNKKNFLNEVIKQKLLKEKEDLTKIINSTENCILTKKRL